MWSPFLANWSNIICLISWASVIPPSGTAMPTAHAQARHCSSLMVLYLSWTLTPPEFGEAITNWLPLSPRLNPRVLSWASPSFELLHLLIFVPLRFSGSDSLRKPISTQTPLFFAIVDRVLNARRPQCISEKKNFIWGVTVFSYLSWNQHPNRSCQNNAKWV